MEGHTTTIWPSLHILHPIAFGCIMRIGKLSNPNVDKIHPSHLLPHLLQANKFSTSICGNFNPRNMANGHKLLHLLLEDALLFSTFSPLCYVEVLLLGCYICIFQPTKASHVSPWNTR